MIKNLTWLLLLLLLMAWLTACGRDEIPATATAQATATMAVTTPIPTATHTPAPSPTATPSPTPILPALTVNEQTVSETAVALAKAFPSPIYFS